MKPFTDAQEMHRKYPDTFEVPAQEKLDRLQAGDEVKVCHNDERFWVKITAVEGETITGIVDNDLICDQPFACGDTIHFEKRHIYSIYEED